MGTYRTYENIKAVILDMDGTLLDTVLDMLEAVNHAMDMAGHPRITYEEFQPLIGFGIGSGADMKAEGVAVDRLTLQKDPTGQQSQKDAQPAEKGDQPLQRMEKGGMNGETVRHKKDLFRFYFPLERMGGFDGFMRGKEI